MSDRQPLGPAERSVYAAVLAEGGRVWFRDVVPEDAPAVLRLLEYGLLVHHTEDGTLTAVNPRSVADRRAAELRTTGQELLSRAERVPAPLEELTQAYDAAPRRSDRSGVVRIVSDMEEIRSRIVQIEAERREEVLAAQPGGARPAEFLAQSLGRDREYLESGGRKLTLYQPGARADGPTVEYAALVTSYGEQVRVLDEPFTRMLVFDRQVAVVPARSDNTAAAFVEDPAVINVLLGIWERDWERAERVRWSELAGMAGKLPVHEQVGRLLAQGLAQRAVASRLGLSERTVAGHIARLRELYDAETLFQLGWQMRGAEGTSEN
ncbi:LuxR family transcriptional regulator [Kitasatospora sp. NPDC051853]|uniref:LuxR family transcriptional regulator n=1 Tax=Kitasatospora sp. NPDC051853 TaxID=3364058 RepID=UPI0037B08C4B